MQLYFIRHGQSQNNANWNNPEYKGSPDPALTEIGVEQACYVSEFLREAQTITHLNEWNVQNRFGFGLTHIYTSLMERAVHTAAPTARALGLPFAAWEQIHESGGIFGRDGDLKLQGLPGKTRAYFEQHFPELTLPDRLNGTGWWNSRPFETEEECQLRARLFAADLITRHADREGEPEHSVAIWECLKEWAYEVHEMSLVVGEALLVKLSAVEAEDEQAQGTFEGMRATREAARLTSQACQIVTQFCIVRFH